MEVHAHDLPNPAGDNFGAATVQIYTANLRVRRRRHANIAGGAHLEIELVVGSDGQIFPAVRLIAWQVAIDHDRFGRIVEVVLDVLDLRYFIQLGDIERTVFEGQTIGPEQRAGEQRLHLAFAIFFRNRIDTVEQARTYENRSFVAARERSRVHHPTGVDFELKALRHF